MTAWQIKEALHFADMLAVAVVQRQRVKEGASFTTPQAAEERVRQARAKLRDYLTQFQTVSDAHTTEGESK